MNLMRFALPALLVLASLTLSGTALAQDESQSHQHGPVDPLLQPVQLYLTADGTMQLAAPQPGLIAAPASDPAGSAAPLVWTIAATHNTTLDSAVNVNVYAKVRSATLNPAAQNGNGTFRVALQKNGADVPGAEAYQKLDDLLLQQDAEYRIHLFIQKVPLDLKPGDTLGFTVTFLGPSLAPAPSMAYTLGGANASGISFRLKYPGMDELGYQADGWKHYDAFSFDFDAAKKSAPAGTRVVTLRAFQFGYNGGPIVVDNSTHVVLQLTIDEGFAPGGGDHSGHAHETPAGVQWDWGPTAPLHGFSLASYDPRLNAQIRDGEVVVLDFQADRPGNYSYLCIVFCGAGHGNMRDVMTIHGLGPGDVQEQQLPPPTGSDGKKTSGFEGLAALGAVGAALLVARRQR
ncbi:MAG: hypothetical protein LC624_02780 [Halobacteriales archaeon]|nr:hypothetical protein [Halobacteriales archaeon]